MKFGDISVKFSSWLWTGLSHPSAEWAIKCLSGAAGEEEEEGGCDQGASTSWHKIQYRQRRGSKKRRGVVRSGQLGSDQCCGTCSSHDDTSQPVQRAARHVWLLDPPLWVQAAVVLLCCERGMMRGRLAARIRRATGRKSGGIAFKIKAGFMSENIKYQRIYRNRSNSYWIHVNILIG